MAEQIAAASQVQVLVTRHSTEIIFTASLLGLLVTPALLLHSNTRNLPGQTNFDHSLVVSNYLLTQLEGFSNRWIVATVGNFARIL